MSVVDKLKLNKYTNMVVINEPSDYDILQVKKHHFQKNMMLFLFCRNA